MKPTLALCMIVKNESAHLAEALDSAAPWVDEMIIVDTGSTDRSVSIGEQAGATVYKFQFEGEVDLGQARTKSINLAQSQWALILDGDTALDTSSGPLLRDVCDRFNNSPRTILGLWQNYCSPENESITTFTRTLLPLGHDRSLIGRRHEYFVDKTGTILKSVRIPEIVVHHWGFTAQNITQKETVHRNARLTLLQLHEKPEYSVFWIDAIRAHLYSPPSQLIARRLLRDFKEALRKNNIRHIGNVTPFQIAFFEALLEFSADRYEEAYDAAVTSLGISPSRDMLAIQAAINAERGFDSIACQQFMVAESMNRKPHPLTGVSNGTYINSKMLTSISQAAARLGNQALAQEWLQQTIATRRDLAEDLPLDVESSFTKCQNHKIPKVTARL